jgi:hypothetical protein
MISLTLLGVIVILASVLLGWWWIKLSENRRTEDFLIIALFLLFGASLIFHHAGSIHLGLILIISFVVLLIAIPFWFLFSASWNRFAGFISGLMINMIVFSLLMMAFSGGAMIVRAIAKLI